MSPPRPVCDAQSISLGVACLLGLGSKNPTLLYLSHHDSACVVPVTGMERAGQLLHRLAGHQSRVIFFLLSLPLSLFAFLSLF